MTPSPSLFARQLSLGFQEGLPVLDFIEPKDADSQASLVTIAASSVERRSCSSSEPSSPATPTQDVLCFDSQQRPRRFSRPSININLVRKDTLSLSEPSRASQCQKLSDRFEGLVKLGEGRCAVVYRAVARSDQREVALKVVRSDDEDHLQIAREEYNLLQEVNHPSIIKVLDFFTHAGGAVLVEELFDGKSLERTTNETKDGHMIASVARQLFAQLLDAIAYLHKQGIVHRDVKAQNVLISHDMTDLRLIDFNVSQRLVDGGALTMTGTPEYMPPEVLRGNSPSEASDVWASGLCFHYMLMGYLPSKRGGIHVQLKGPEWERLSEPCKDILRKCLEPRRDLRPQAKEMLSYSRLPDSRIGLG